MRITRAEARYLIAACVLAAILGCLAGFSAYTAEAEAQFHGGVLPEDVAEAKADLAQAALCGFAKICLPAVLIFGIVPIGVRRYLSGGHDGA